ncbi:PqqD family protein [Fibrella forsythiae]|uniref:PqqD family protein n=1 Tax=Fibrella forsythiae TaxID=2817061 RepID=A0ABS3JH69_9BACT|nr:PqqD family protein [Fibrella forsythiae]MBO0949354.1 PqqD family protein [Fibrella forsythiae]
MYQINSNQVLFTQMGEDGVIFDIKNNQYVTLNATYTRIFMLLEQQQTEESIVDALVNEYNVDPTTCAKAVTRCLSELKEKLYIS